MASHQSEMAEARAHTRSVVGACGAALARDVQEQLDALAARWHRAAAAQHAFNERYSTALVGDHKAKLQS